MVEKLKTVAGTLTGLVVLLALLSIPAIFLLGAVWASRTFLPMLVALGWIALAIVVFLLLPLSLFRSLRSLTGSAIFLSSYLFGLIAWLTGVVITYSLWGAWAVVLGLVLLGGGVVPIGMIASLFSGKWMLLGTLFALTVLTFATRLGGISISNSGDKR